MAMASHDRNFAKEVKIPQSVAKKFDHYDEGGQVDPMTDTSWLFEGYADGGRLRDPRDPVGGDLQFYDYDPKPLPVGTPATTVPVVGTPTVDNNVPLIPYVPAIGMNSPDGGIGVGGPSGPGASGANSGGIGVGPSSIGGTGIGSIASNIGMGNAQGAIAALMGLAGMVSPAVGVVSSIASLANSLGIQGLTNGIAVSNDQSSNNVANDVAAIEGVANSMGLGVNSPGVVGQAAIDSGQANQNSAEAGSNGGVGNAGTGGTAADAGSVGGVGLAHGGRIPHPSNYNHFKPQFARGGRFW